MARSQVRTQACARLSSSSCSRQTTAVQRPHKEHRIIVLEHIRTHAVARLKRWTDDHAPVGTLAARDSRQPPLALAQIGSTHAQRKHTTNIPKRQTSPTIHRMQGTSANHPPGYNLQTESGSLYARNQQAAHQGTPLLLFGRAQWVAGAIQREVVRGMRAVRAQRQGNATAAVRSTKALLVLLLLLLWPPISPAGRQRICKCARSFKQECCQSALIRLTGLSTG